MSIIEEFLQQNCNPYISPSLVMELSNIKTALTFMQEHIQQTRLSFDKGEAIREELERATRLLQDLNVFVAEINKESTEIDIKQLSRMIVESGQLEEGWVYPFVISKENQARRLMISGIREAIKQSQSTIEKQVLQKYISLLEQLKSTNENSKQPPEGVIREADNLRREFMNSLNIDRMKQLATQNINGSINKIRDTIVKLNQSFDLQLEREEKREQSTVKSPLKSLVAKSQKSQSVIETPVKEIGEQQKSIMGGLHLSQSKLIDSLEHSYLMTLGKPRFNYLSRF